MRLRTILPLLSLAVFAMPLNAAPPPLRVAETQAGGYAIGNPKAPIHLIEFVSYTCSHCAHFSNESHIPLKRDYVARGKVYYEVRNGTRDAFDNTAALLARCGGSAKFFPIAEDILANQDKWAAAGQTLKADDLRKVDQVTAFRRIATATGLVRLVARHGLSGAQINACLANKQAQAKIEAMTKDAFGTRQLPGTPGFIINETVYEGGVDWASVKPALDAVYSALTPQHKGK